jgi:hypothetical protein
MRKRLPPVSWRAALAVEVLSGGDEVGLFQGRVGGFSGEGEGLGECEGKGRGCRLEKVATLHVWVSLLAGAVSPESKGSQSVARPNCRTGSVRDRAFARLPTLVYGQKNP